jgi:hypothetical protein
MTSVSSDGLGGTFNGPSFNLVIQAPVAEAEAELDDTSSQR